MTQIITIKAGFAGCSIAFVLPMVDLEFLSSIDKNGPIQSNKYFLILVSCLLNVFFLPNLSPLTRSNAWIARK
jgi:hypothetical protein